MKKYIFLAVAMALLAVLAVSSCSKRKNIIPVGPDDIFTATYTPYANTATGTATRTFTSVPATYTRTGTAVIPSPTPTATCSPTATGTSTVPSRTFTATATGTAVISSATDTPEYSPTVTGTITATWTGSPVFSPTATPTITGTATDTPLPPSATSTGTVTSTRTNTLTGTSTPVITPTYTCTTAVAVIIYDGDTAGTRLADGTVTNDGAGTMTETTGGNPGNMMRLTYVNAGWWQQLEWNKTVNVDIGANTYFMFDVRLAPGSPNPEKQFKVRISWDTGLDVFAAGYLVEGGLVDSTWKTVKIPLSYITGTGQTQIDFVAFIGNTDINYTVDVDNIRLEGSVPSATPTFTNTLNPAWSQTFTPTITATKTPGGSSFVHPGAWSSADELDFVKTKIAAGQQPWTQQLAYLIGSAGGAPSGVNFNGVIQNSCTQEGAVQTDSALVYANALAWYLTGTQSYYTKAMSILANYAGLLGFQSTACYSGQSILDASWFGVLFANACELLRTNPGWTAANTATYTNMFKTAFYPKLNTMSPDNGNIDLTQIDAMFSMAVFCDDQAEWNLAVSRYQARMPAAFIDSTWTGVPAAGMPAALGNVNTNNCGGASSPPVDFWYCPAAWPAGLGQETCRDLGHHEQFALDAAVDSAEIDYHQGSPAALYANYQTMLRPALELLAKQFVTVSTCGTCAGTWPANQQKLDMFEAGFNHYANRMGAAYAGTTDPLYYTNQWINTLRANAGTTWLQFNIAYEALTHAGVY